MKLYKNVDIEYLERILYEGILPISKTGNNVWDEGLRGNNSLDLVYLAKPLGLQNSFTQYGLVLLEVETNAWKNEMIENDANLGLYDEYVVGEVKPSEIKNIYVPKIFKDRLDEYFNQETLDKITWVEMDAKGYFEEDTVYRNATKEELSIFAKTAALSIEQFNYFRGTIKIKTLFVETEEIFDIYEVRYLI
ncbi:hypothetical protein [Microaceticoccus formicicus]|uniref:hypothetical protein n=1 Tax=Microaceticoccus formicicus TaxID=3118105 RepID=UPI003CD0039A|nr:hypothetical protein VZL98_01750 [Peptoniphilaceae bacterium AMB_02]